MSNALALPVADFVKASWNPPYGLTDAENFLGIAGDVRGMISRQVDKELKRNAPSDSNQQLLDSRVFPISSGLDDVVISVPNLFTPRAIQGWSVRTLQEWEGVVENVEKEEFTARLRDLTSDGTPVELATIPLSEIDPDDLKSVTPGAIFNLIIGYFNRGNGQRRETVVYFRKFGATPNNEAQQLASLLDVIA